MAAAEASAMLASSRGELVSAKEYPTEIEVRGEAPRIGCFICHCGIVAGVAFAIMVAMLIWRPSGLFGGKAY